jgi:starch synthase (maltosyl-transferring)
MEKKSELRSTSKHLAGLGEGRSRVVIENVKPEIDCGRFAAKRTVGEPMTVEADIFADGHDALSARLLYRKQGTPHWTEIPMQPLPNDRWRGTFGVTEVGDYDYTVQAWVDRFKSWRQALAKKAEAGQDVALDLTSGAMLVEAAAKQANEDQQSLKRFAATLKAASQRRFGSAWTMSLRR